MSKAPTKTVDPACPKCGGTDFELHVLKEDGIGAARCIRCERNYLLLDSEDYWFDVIQRGYPRAARCSCKSTAFQLRIEYLFREDGLDVKSIQVSSTCAACGRTKRQFSADIDYGDAQHLVTRPLTPCVNPKILYDLRQLTLYATRADIARVLEYLAAHEKLTFDCCVRESDQWVHRRLAFENVRQLVLDDEGSLCATPYLWIYASDGSIPIPTAKQSIKQEDAFWKRHEVVRISSPTRVGLGTGSFDQVALLFYISFSCEFVEDQRVIAKSPTFRTMTARLLGWLGKHFVSWRGPDSFDNPQEHVRAFGDRFQKRPTRRNQ